MRLRNIPGAKEEIRENRFVADEPAKLKGGWSLFFGNANPVHIEVGMGKGRFLTELARLHPEINYVGIEMYDSVLIRAVQKREELADKGEDLSNLIYIREDARMLPEIFAGGEVEKIYLNFSDPWPKARHAKRRLTSRQFLARYEQILAEDGIIEFKTDNQELFAFALEEISGSGWELLYSTRDLHSDEKLMEGNVMTEYEEKFSSMGNPICKLAARMERKQEV